MRVTLESSSWKRQATRLIASRILATLSFQMQAVAVGWQVYEITRRPLDLGILGLVQFFPMLFLSIPAGQVADRFSRRKILRLCHVIASLSTLGLYLISREPTVLLIYSFLFVEACARAFGGSSNQALLPDIVPPTEFSRVVALSSSAWQAAMVAGPALGGILYAWTREASFVYGTAFVLLSLSVLLLGFVREPNTTREKSPVSFESLIAGFKFIGKKRVLLGSVSLDLMAVLLGGAVALLPMFAAEVLHVGPSGLGWLRSAPGFGAALMAVWLGTHPIRARAGRKMFAAVFIFGLAIMGFGLSTQFLPAFICLFISGAADVVSVVVRQTLAQAETPTSMRGRVASVNLIFISASNELGEFESGLTAQWWGLIPAIIVGGIGTCVVAFFWSRLFPELRELDKL